MDLVKQLGGYNKAKEYLENLQKIHSHEQTEDTIVWLPRALLEYRRKHNMYEVNDFVTSKKWVDGSIHKIELVGSEDKTLKIFSHDMAFSYWVDSRNYRHATDDEIKKGFK